MKKTNRVVSLLVNTIIFLLLLHSCQSKSVKNQIHTQIKLDKHKGLKDWGEFPIGGAIEIQNVLADEKLKAITEKNFNSITATNDMKMSRLVSQECSYDWGTVDTLIAFCIKNNQRLHGHTLVWDFGVPDWIITRAKRKWPRMVK